MGGGGGGGYQAAKRERKGEWRREEGKKEKEGLLGSLCIQSMPKLTSLSPGFRIRIRGQHTSQHESTTDPFVFTLTHTHTHNQTKRTTPKTNNSHTKIRRHTGSQRDYV